MRCPIVGIVSEIRSFQGTDKRTNQPVTRYQVVIDQKGEDLKIPVSFDSVPDCKEGDKFNRLCRVSATSRGLWVRLMEEKAG